MARKTSKTHATSTEQTVAQDTTPKAQDTTPTTPAVSEAEQALAKAKAEAKAAREAARAEASKARAEAKASRKAAYEAKLVEWQAQREAIPARYADRVVSVTARGVGGRPVRVVVRCQHPGCEQTREIALQDAFQVKYCLEHRKAHRKAAQTTAPDEQDGDEAIEA